MRLSLRALSGLAVLGLAAFSAAACNPITADGVRRERQPAWIQFHGDPVAVEIPEVVDRGTEFEVTVRTYGGGCIDKGDTEVAISGARADVRPYDIFVTQAPENYLCADVLYLYAHRATLRFDQPGAATVRVHGRTIPGDAPLVVERTVQIR